jgi:Glyceraldehyde-3-phosphate dehydrogenase/erythrose-4-phosphate dehydrogenase
MKRIGINGFGRIGRCVFRNLWERGNAECVYINDPNMTIDNLIYLLKYDSVYGRFEGKVKKVGENAIQIFSENKVWNITVGTFKELYKFFAAQTEIDILVDATGNGLCAQQSWDYVEKGLKNVIVTNTFYEADFTYIGGYNDNELDSKKHKVISTSICDANATVPLLSKLLSYIGVEFCFVTTLHPWLSYQNLMDAPVKMQKQPSQSMEYFPLGRSSVNTLIPKTTTLGTVLKYVFPELEHKLSFVSFRTPTQMVASAEMSLVLSRAVNKREIIEVLQQCDQRIISLNKEDIISIDCEKQPYSSIVDLRWIDVVDRYLKLITWYDNEWGYCSRVIDLIEKL